MKLRRKLISAGFALGATALTLTTSTFAWYTSNTSVTVDNITGVTSTEADSNSFYVSAANQYEAATATTPYAPAGWDDYKSSATPHLVNGKTLASMTGATGAETLTGTVLEPVYFDTSAGTLKKIATVSGSTVTYASQESKNDYIEYVLRFRTATAATQATPIYVKEMTVANTVSELPTQYALATGGKTGVGSVGVYSTDMRHALKMSVEVASVDSTGTTASAYAAPSIYGLDTFATLTGTNLTVTSENNAIGYYNAVLGTSMAAPSANYSDGTELSYSSTSVATAPTVLFSIPDTGYVQVRFRFYLDGWDLYCYDVCRQQGVTIGMTFTVNNTEAHLGTIE